MTSNTPRPRRSGRAMTALEELAARAEALTGPDREVDALIWLACVPNATRHELRYMHKATGKECVIDETRENGRLVVVPEYSTSLDAAMTLVAGPDAVREAMSSLSEKFALHMCFWPVAENYGEWLARYTTAASLRALSQSKEPL